MIQPLLPVTFKLFFSKIVYTYFFLFMLFLISYKFTDANAQEKGSKMLKEWYDKGGPQNRPEGYDV